MGDKITLNKVINNLSKNLDVIKINKIVKCCEHIDNKYTYRLGYLGYKRFRVMICTECGGAILICNWFNRLLFNLIKFMWDGEIYLYNSDTYSLMVHNERQTRKYLLVKDSLLKKLDIGV